MTWYVLKATKPGRWSEAESYPWQGNDFPFQLLREFEIRGKGISVFEMDSISDPLLETLAAAFGFLDGKAASTFPKIMLRFADSSVVAALKISILKTEAEFEGFKVPQLSAIHCDLQLNGEMVVELARHMKGQPPRVFSSNEVGRLVAEHLNANVLPKSNLDGSRLKALDTAKRIQIV